MLSTSTSPDGRSSATLSVSDTAAGSRIDRLVGGGEMGERIRAFDWSKTPLGPPAHWPQSLRSAVSILLPSKAQIVLFWGRDLVTLYNDAYRPVFGAKHLLLPLTQLRRSKPFRVCERLPAFVFCRHARHVSFGHFDEIAEDVIKLDAQIGDAAALALGSFERGDNLFGVSAE